jgi:hypothetical protein
MRYKRPPASALTDYLEEPEFLAMVARRATAREMDARARSNAWKAHRETGPSGRISWLCECEPGASVLLSGYTSTKQTSPIVAAVATREERLNGQAPRLAQRVERHDLTDVVIGVRVTFLGFDSSDGS